MRIAIACLAVALLCACGPPRGVCVERESGAREFYPQADDFYVSEECVSLLTSGGVFGSGVGLTRRAGAVRVYVGPCERVACEEEPK